MGTGPIESFLGGISMKLFLYSLSFVLILASNISSQPCNDERARVRYVQSGASAPGLGSKKNPYISLAQAQSHNTEWETLIVLGSTTALDGGITLLDGQKLIGEVDPIGNPFSPEQSLITNMSLSSNGGNGIVVSGDATIKNIYIKDTKSNVILYDNAKDLTVKNLRVSDFVSGIVGTCKNPGKTHFERVKMVSSSSANSHGIFETVLGGIKREFEACLSDFSGFSSSSSSSSCIEVAAHDANTESNVTITRSSFHDNVLARGLMILLIPSLQAQQHSHVDECNFYNNPAAGDIGADPTDVGTFEYLEIDSCLFKLDAIVNNSTAGRDAIRFRTITGSKGELVVTRNTVLYRAALLGCQFNGSLSNKDSLQKVTVCNNNVTANEFFFVFNSTSSSPAGTNFPSLYADIKNNLYNGVYVSGAPTTNAFDLQTITGPWNIFDLDIERNCFIGGHDPSNNPTGSAFLVNPIPPTSNLSNHGTIRACHNNFENFLYEVHDTQGNLNYLLCQNWWGPSTGPCTPCGTYQTCKHGNCFGPTDSQIVITGTGNTSVVNASNPLLNPLPCPPHGCSK